MFYYDDQIKDYHSKKVRIGEDTQKTLRKHREANQKRLKRNIREDITISDSDFVKQGSYANMTMVQHKDNDYDIDDGVIFKKEELVGDKGGEMSALDVRKMVEDALQDDKFDKKPERKVNCVRVFYKEGHHVDVPSYRVYQDADGNGVLELAGADWRKSDPREINRWFEGEATGFNDLRDGRRLQLRVMIRLLKRFCRSRDSWTMPSGIILTMLTTKEFPDYERDDECFYHLLQKLQMKLSWNLRVYNEADTDTPKEELTKSAEDSCMTLLRDKVDEALNKLAILHDAECTLTDARKAWDWVFKTDGHFEDYDEKNCDESTQQNTARTSQLNFSSPNISESRFQVPWCEEPRWPLDFSANHKVTLSGESAISETRINCRSIENDGPALDKNLYLKFTAETTVKRPFHVYWQIVNTGPEALTAEQRRGRIIGSSYSGEDGLDSRTAHNIGRKERTKYTGMHWVECYIVQNKVCVARSGPFVVNIIK